MSLRDYRLVELREQINQAIALAASEGFEVAVWWGDEYGGAQSVSGVMGVFLKDKKS